MSERNQHVWHRRDMVIKSDKEYSNKIINAKGKIERDLANHLQKKTGQSSTKKIKQEGMNPMVH
jgi:hypothetical protein